MCFACFRLIYVLVIVFCVLVFGTSCYLSLGDLWYLFRCVLFVVLMFGLLVLIVGLLQCRDLGVFFCFNVFGVSGFEWFAGLDILVCCLWVVLL